MAVRIAPSPRQQFEDANGVPYVGGKLFTYAAGSSTKQSTFTDSTGNTANANPIVLDAAGRTPFGLWLTAGLNYKFVLALSTDTDPPTSPVFTEDNISGVNDSATTTSQWIAAGATPTYINSTTFTLVGDKTADFHVGRRLKLTVTAGTVYGLISAVAYTTLTTVTVVMDSGALDSGLSAVELSILLASGHAIPKLSSANLTALGIQPTDAELTTLAGITAQQATDLASVSTFVGTALNDANEAAFRVTTGTRQGKDSTFNFTASTALSNAHAGAAILYSGGAPGTLTLPNPATLSARGEISVCNISAFACTVARFSTENIYALGSIGTSIVLNPNESIILFTDLVSWFQTATGLIPPIGVGQTWQTVTRVSGTTYTNTTGKAIQFKLTSSSGAAATELTMTVGAYTFPLVLAATSQRLEVVNTIIPAGSTYSYVLVTNSVTASELR